MRKIMRALSVSLSLVAGLFLFARLVNATTIEGYTPSGNFQTVFVSDSGRLFVSIDSTTPQHVTVDGGTLTHITDPVQVTGPGGVPINVTIPGGVTANVVASTATTSTSAQFNVGMGGSVCYPAIATRKQGVLCNSSDTANIYIGPLGVTVLSGALLGPGSCYSPDVPAAYVGSLSCISTAAASGFYIYSE
jgi:hypothetical protein